MERGRGLGWGGTEGGSGRGPGQPSQTRLRAALRAPESWGRLASRVTSAGPKAPGLRTAAICIVCSAGASDRASVPRLLPERPGGAAAGGPGRQGLAVPAGALPGQERGGSDPGPPQAARAQSSPPAPRALTCHGQSARAGGGAQGVGSGALVQACILLARLGDGEQLAAILTRDDVHRGVGHQRLLVCGEGG